MDAMIGVLMPCSFIVGLTAKPNASQTMQRIINKWAAIRWDDETLAFNAKMDEYFEGMHQIISFMDMSETTDVLLFIVIFEEGVPQFFPQPYKRRWGLRRRRRSSNIN